MIQLLFFLNLILSVVNADTTELVNIYNVADLSETEYEQLINKIEESGFLDEDICFEITESTVMMGSDSNPVNFPPQIPCPFASFVSNTGMVTFPDESGQPRNVPGFIRIERPIHLLSTLRDGSVIMEKIQDNGFISYMGSLIKDRESSQALAISDPMVKVNGYSSKTIFSMDKKVKKHLAKLGDSAANFRQYIPFYHPIRIFLRMKIMRIQYLIIAAYGPGLKAITELYPDIFHPYEYEQ